MNSIAVKQLRSELPDILQRVEKGESFIIIYRSKPVGELVPMEKRRGQPSSPSFYQLLEKPFGEVHLPRGTTSADLIRNDRR